MAKVLMFHRVLPYKLITQPNAYSTFGTLITQEYFETVLSCLADNGFRFTTVSELTQQSDTDKLVALSRPEKSLHNLVNNPDTSLHLKINPEYALQILFLHYR